MTTDVATLLSQLQSFYPEGAPTDQQVRAQQVGFRPAQWAKRWPDGVARPGIIDRVEPASITRVDLFAEAETVSSEADAVAAFVGICAWGTGTKARSVARCAKALADPELGSKLLRARDVAIADPADTYTSMMGGGQNKVDGLGPAFFSKWLHFSAYDRCEAAQRPLILDALVAAALGWHSTGWSAITYAAYLDIADQVRDQWCPGQPTYTVEYGLFYVSKTQRALGAITTRPARSDSDA